MYDDTHFYCHYCGEVFEKPEYRTFYSATYERPVRHYQCPYCKDTSNPMDTEDKMIEEITEEEIELYTGKSFEYHMEDLEERRSKKKEKMRNGQLDL